MNTHKRFFYQFEQIPSGKCDKNKRAQITFFFNRNNNWIVDFCYMHQDNFHQYMMTGHMSPIINNY